MGCIYSAVVRKYSLKLAISQAVCSIIECKALQRPLSSPLYRRSLLYTVQRFGTALRYGLSLVRLVSSICPLRICLFTFGHRKGASKNTSLVHCFGFGTQKTYRCTALLVHITTHICSVILLNYDYNL